MIPSTVSWVLSLVMQTWLGTSSGTSFSECLYATRSTNGTTNVSPGVSVRSYLPSFSTIQACCCGTILIARITNSTAMTARTRATSMMGGLSLLCLCCCSSQFDSVRGHRLEHEPVAFDGDDA